MAGIVLLIYCQPRSVYEIREHSHLDEFASRHVGHFDLVGVRSGEANQDLARLDVLRPGNTVEKDVLLPNCQYGFSGLRCSSHTVGSRKTLIVSSVPLWSFRRYMKTSRPPVTAKTVSSS